MTEFSIIIPIRNEEESIKPFLESATKVLEKINKPYEIIFSMDPSVDNTEKVILEEIEKNKKIKLLVFSRKFGQPAATLAGIHNSKGKYCVIIDVDLQDPPELIEKMYKKISEGYDVVYAKRSSRKGETLIKKIVSSFAYFIINKISEINIPVNTGDFRIISRKVADELKKLSEGHGFLRGMVAFVGYKQSFVEYDRVPRFAGKRKYNKFFGSLKIGINGIVGYSSKPLTFLLGLGSFISLVSLFFIVNYFFNENSEYGLIVSIVTFFTGIQLFGLGVIGEYVGRIYDEVKRRPNYIIDKKINFEN
jgi:glycosyltransferase involved in cell wall biosynthesis